MLIYTKDIQIVFEIWKNSEKRKEIFTIDDIDTFWAITKSQAKHELALSPMFVVTVMHSHFFQILIAMCEATADIQREIIPYGGSLPPDWSWKLILFCLFNN